MTTTAAVILPVKIKKAIILDYAFLADLNPATYQKPAGLLVFQNEVLIERLIKQLKNSEVEEIYLVAGYYSEKLLEIEIKYQLRLLIYDNFQDVSFQKLLQFLLPYLDQSLVIRSNLYFTDLNLNSLKLENWCIYDNSLHHGKEYLGAFYLGKEFKELVSLLDKSYFNEIELFNQFLQLFKNVKNQYNFYLLNHINQALKLDRDFLITNKNDVLKTIAKIFQIDLSLLKDFHIIKKGMTNNSFTFSINKKQYIFRLSGFGSDKLLSRKNEAAVYQTLKDYDISDEVIYFDANKGYKIAYYYHDSTSLTAYRAQDIFDAMELLNRLHQKKLVVNHTFEFSNWLETYYQLTLKQKVSFPDNFAEFKVAIEKLIKELQLLNRPAVLCHIDSVAGNILRLKEGRHIFIDWEYAGMADPMLDVAMYAISANYNPSLANQLLNIYLKRDASAFERNLFYHYIVVASFLWSIWALYKQAIGIDYEKYYTDKYQIAQNYFDLLKSFK